MDISISKICQTDVRVSEMTSMETDGTFPGIELNVP